MDLWPFDVRRFGTPHSVKAFMYDRAAESYARYYHIAWPAYEADAGRNGRRSPLYETLKAAGAVYGNKFGWERPNWFAPPGTPAIDVPSFDRGAAFAAIGEEHRAIRERVALIDMTSFSKYEVRGAGALALLQKVAANDVDRPIGGLVYTQLCNARGGIEADVTITRLAVDRFYFVTGSALGVRDRSTLERHLPADGSVEIIDLTSSRSVLNLCGPRSRDVLAKLTDAPLDQRTLPVHERARARSRLCAGAGTSRHLSRRARLRAARAGGIRARSLSAAVVGGRGVRHRQCGLPRGQQPAAREALPGLGAATSRRTTIRTKRDWVSAWRSTRVNSLAREALAAVKASGPKQRLTSFTAGSAMDLFGGEIVLAGDKVIGRVSSAGYGYTCKRNIFCAYLAADAPKDAAFAIEAMDVRYPAQRHPQPPYDPERKAILA